MPDTEQRTGTRRARLRRALNALCVVAAVGGIAVGGWNLWTVLANRARIDEACAGLVPPGRVLALSPAGGSISHRVADEGTVELDADMPQDCEIFSTEAGEKYGTSSGERWFFTGAVGVLPGGPPAHPEDPVDRLVDRWGDGRTYPLQPLGGGIAGLVTENGVSVELPCTDGRWGNVDISSLWASARLTDPGPPFTVNGQLSQGDRDTLAQTAVLTANRFAERLGCHERLPDAPRHIPALKDGTAPAAGAGGTCRWFRDGGFADRHDMPDQVLESRTDPKAWHERCGLVLGSARAGALWSGWKGSREDKKYAYPEDTGDYWASFHTWFGDDARDVRLSDHPGGITDTPTGAGTGTAGRGADSEWWASSVCRGRPAVHTLTLSYKYDRLVRPAYEKVFRAYVADVARRRGCTQVRFPGAADFSGKD
ncbi:hypothetical protein ACWCP6_09455 [Streptomyces sp. NPDC002004]